MPLIANVKHKNARPITVSGVMLSLILSICAVMGFYGCEKEPTCDSALEWESPAAELGIFLLQQDLYQYDEAQLYCENLVLRGKSDWRLPTECELSALGSGLYLKNGGSALSSRIATCWSSTPYHDSLLR
ncbi:MAG: hypothetical protein ABR516_06380, partial [Desulfuromonadaceae bacterium]